MLTVRVSGYRVYDNSLLATQHFSKFETTLPFLSLY